MSWLCHILRGEIPHRPPLGKWICDHCAEVYHEDARTPLHTYKHDRKDFPMLAGRAGARSDQRRPPWINEVHYCSDECAEVYVSAVVERGLTQSAKAPGSRR